MRRDVAPPRTRRQPRRQNHVSAAQWMPQMRECRSSGAQRSGARLCCLSASGGERSKSAQEARARWRRFVAAQQ